MIDVEYRSDGDIIAGYLAREFQIGIDALGGREGGTRSERRGIVEATLAHGILAHAATRKGIEPSCMGAWCVGGARAIELLFQVKPICLCLTLLVGDRDAATRRRSSCRGCGRVDLDRDSRYHEVTEALIR